MNAKKHTSKKVFALGSITALVGMASAAGCSSTGLLEPDGSQRDAAPDATSERRPVPRPQDDVDPWPSPRPAQCEPIDATKFPYTKALKAAGACTDDERKAIGAYFKAKTDANEEVSVAAWSKEVSATCAACAFGAEDAGAWSPILVKADQLENVNRGGCIEIVSGSEDCGRAYQQAVECRIEACRKCPKTQDEFAECVGDEASYSGVACKDAFDGMRTACGDGLAAYRDACKGTAWTFDGPIRVQCITGGVDPDAGDGG